MREYPRFTLKSNVYYSSSQVIDDESDYFSVDSNKWLSADQREKLRKREEELREKRHGSRLNRKIDFDFAGRKVVETDGGVGEYDPAMVL